MIIPKTYWTSKSSTFQHLCLCRKLFQNCAVQKRELNRLPASGNTLYFNLILTFRSAAQATILAKISTVLTKLFECPLSARIEKRKNSTNLRLSSKDVHESEKRRTSLLAKQILQNIPTGVTRSPRMWQYGASLETDYTKDLCQLA